MRRVAEKLRKTYFNYIARNVRKTKPVEYEFSNEVVIVSQVYHQAVDMTLLAIKSFMTNFGKGSVELIDDGSLTEGDYRLFRLHIPKVKIIHIDEIDTRKLPKGSCWERLIRILELSKNAYVIQVDTDTVTMGYIPEVFDHFINNKAFTIGSPSFPELANLEYIATINNVGKSDHVQSLAEIALSKITSIKLDKYARGCAAFTGFPKGGCSSEDLDAFSAEMELLLGQKKWTEWGSEQLSSNVMISLCEDAKILPWPKYQNYKYPVFNSSSNYQNFHGIVSVVHFIGSNRFSDNTYAILAKRFIHQNSSFKVDL